MIEMMYTFKAPASVKVLEEYLIYDTIGMIGSAGGTLGLFIGFSFSNIIAFIINVIEKIYMSTKGRCSHLSTAIEKESDIKQIEVIGFEKIADDQSRVSDFEKEFATMKQRISQIEDMLFKST